MRAALLLCVRARTCRPELMRLTNNSALNFALETTACGGRECLRSRCRTRIYLTSHLYAPSRTAPPQWLRRIKTAVFFTSPQWLHYTKIQIFSALGALCVALFRWLFAPVRHFVPHPGRALLLEAERRRHQAIPLELFVECVLQYCDLPTLLRCDVAGGRELRGSSVRVISSHSCTALFRMTAVRAWAQDRRRSTLAAASAAMPMDSTVEPTTTRKPAILESVVFSLPVTPPRPLIRPLPSLSARNLHTAWSGGLIQ